MSKGVSKQCSILNYVRHNDEQLYELIQDLCLGKIFMPRRGSPGITFLRPDKALLKEIQEMAAGDQPEDAIEALQSLVLLDNLSSIKDFDEKKSDIPTYLRKKLQVVSADGKKVVLKNGAEIVPDKDFQARSDRGNISVYMISKALVPTDGPDADFSNAKIKPKKGGAELGGSRAQLFERVLHNFCESKQDPAMELLAALHGWAAKNKPAVADAIASKCSYDTLASLAIVLQPYKSSPTHLSNEDLSSFISEMYGQSGESGLFQTLPVYSLRKDVSEYYDKLAGAEHKDAVRLRTESEDLARGMGKLNAVKKLNAYYDQKFPGTKSLAFAEAELRVMSAMLLENSDGRYDYQELSALYRACNLDAPYVCADKDLVANANIGFYYSTVYLIARSDALNYVPNLNGSKSDAISNDQAYISLNLTMQDMLRDRRSASQVEINRLRKQIEDNSL